MHLLSAGISVGLLSSTPTRRILSVEENQIRESRRSVTQRANFAIVQLIPGAFALHVRDVMPRAHSASCVNIRIAHVRHIPSHCVLRMPFWSIAHGDLDDVAGPIRRCVHSEILTSGLVYIFDTEH